MSFCCSCSRHTQSLLQNHNDSNANFQFYCTCFVYTGQKSGCDENRKVLLRIERNLIWHRILNLGFSSISFFFICQRSDLQPSISGR